MSKFTYHLKSPSKVIKAKTKSYTAFEKQVLSLIKNKIVTNEKEYNSLLKEIKKLSEILSVQSPTSPLFEKELSLIHKKRPLTESTVWGGVTLKKVDVAKDFIQKLLVINQGGVLGFEIHKKKKERLLVLEGYCLVFWINHNGKSNHTIAFQLAGPKDTFTFAPKDEHGILTLTKCIIEETSTNHLDDLMYIFHASC